MSRVMIFIDHLNFEIATYEYYEKLQLPSPKLDYNKFPKLLSKFLEESRLVRTYVFYPKPDLFLMNDKNLKSYYEWVNGTLKNIRYLDVIEGEYVSRPVSKDIPKDINNQTTYTKVEKGTDINIATNMLSKAFHNAFDVALLLSGDSDFSPVIQQVCDLGKNVISIGVKGQDLSKLKKRADDLKILDKTFFDQCLRT